MNGEAKWINGWYYKSSMTYSQFLQAREFEKSHRYAIEEQIANSKDLAEMQITAIQEQNQLIFDLKSAITEKMDEINGTLNWGFTEVLASIGRVNDQLSELIRIAKSPAQTWAYEQYDIARNAFHKELFPEALKYLDRAIDGYAGASGYDLDFRFHYLKGIIHLGSFKNNDPAVVDPRKAEASFLLAARYAHAEARHDSARALLLASRAAYCDRRLADASTHIENCISSARTPIAEAYFERAKIKCASGSPGNFDDDIIKAISLDLLYAVKFYSDGDLSAYLATIIRRLEADKNRYLSELKAIQDFLQPLLEGLTSISSLGQKSSEDLAVSKIKEILQSIQDAMSKPTYIRSLTLWRLCEDKKTIVRKVVADSLSDQRQFAIHMQIELEKNKGVSEFIGPIFFWGALPASIPALICCAAFESFIAFGVVWVLIVAVVAKKVIGKKTSKIRTDSERLESLKNILSKYEVYLQP